MSGRLLLLAFKIARARVLLESEVSGVTVALLLGVGVLSVSGGVGATTISVALLLRVDAFAILGIAQGVGSNVDEL